MDVDEDFRRPLAFREYELEIVFHNSTVGSVVGD